jgi:hypothetical protein
MRLVTFRHPAEGSGARIDAAAARRPAPIPLHRRKYPVAWDRGGFAMARRNCDMKRDF